MGLATEWPRGDGVRNKVENIFRVCLPFPSTCYSLSRFCSKLKHLDLTSCVSVTNSSLKGIR